MKAMWIAFGFSVVIAFVADYGLNFAGYSTQENQHRLLCGLTSKNKGKNTPPDAAAACWCR